MYTCWKETFGLPAFLRNAGGLILCGIISCLGIFHSNAAQLVKFQSATFPPTSFQTRMAQQRGEEPEVFPGAPIQGYLVHPAGDGPFPAVVLLHGCGSLSRQQVVWTRRLSSWGYVVLAVDSFTTRGIQQICDGKQTLDLPTIDQTTLSGLLRPLQRVDRIPIAELSALLLGSDAAAAEALRRPLEPGVPQSYESRRSRESDLPKGRYVGQFTLQAFDRNSGLAQIHWAERADPRDLQALRGRKDLLQRHDSSLSVRSETVPPRTQTFEATAQVALDDGVPRRVEYRAISIDPLPVTHTRTYVIRKLP